MGTTNVHSKCRGVVASISFDMLICADEDRWINRLICHHHPMLCLCCLQTLKLRRLHSTQLIKTNLLVLQCDQCHRNNVFSPPPPPRAKETRQMRFQHFDSLYITTPRVSAAMTARRQKVCLIGSVQPMNRSTSAAGDHADGLALQDDSSAHVQLAFREKYRS